ncbi:MAG: ABC transporter ATP-binding protein [Oscillospiraceae bacterium]|jgi:ABC-type lipoprotein export system ATPase subunit|nr:ABC transporter ATP-binding protein [Oscillospiraceae bacterium]
MDNEIIVCENLVKIYKTKDLEVLALQGLDLTIERGELMAIIGNSGSGKSTLLNMLGGLDKPSAGKLFVDGKDLFKLNEKELSDYKRGTVGFVWQNNARNLIPYLTALNNVVLPMQFAGDARSASERREWAMLLLELVGLEDKAKKRLAELSGGEQQRVALAIGLANTPKILLADEPTGSVDVNTCMQIMSFFRKFNEELGVTVIIVTHDTTLTQYVKRVVSIRDGKVSSEFLGLSRGESEDAFEAFSHEEYAILDRAGRVQIPDEFLKRLDLPGNRVKLTLDDETVKMSRPGSG